MQDWQSALASKLESENQDVEHSLATLNPSDALSSVKVHSERRLLSMTSKALGVLDDGMEAGLTKDRISAATKVLDLSPATRIQTTFTSEQSIPIEALKTILEGMANMFKGASVQFANSTEIVKATVVEDAVTDVVKEVVCETAPDPERAPRRPDTPASRRPAVRRNAAIYDDGVQEEEVLPKPPAKGTRRTEQLKTKHKPRGKKVR